LIKSDIDKIIQPYTFDILQSLCWKVSRHCWWELL